MTVTNPSIRELWARRIIREKLYKEFNKIQAYPLQPAHRTPSTSLRASEALPGIIPAPLPGLGSFGNLFTEPLSSPFDLPADVNRPDPGEITEPPSRRGHGPQNGIHHRFGSTPGSDPPAPPVEEYKICIIGAGVTGLYIAMILDSLQIPGLTYEILEASDRAGGRLLTHHFSKAKHDYYDIGAMRFPHIDSMKRTFDLFEKLDVPLIKYYLNDKQGAKNCPTMYNDITVISGSKPGPDPYHVGVTNGGSVPDDTVDDGDNLLERAFGSFKKDLDENFNKGFERLMRYDEYSTREFLRNPPPRDPDVDPKLWPEKPLDFYTIQWLETNNTSSGLYDQAFSESVMDSFDFDNPNHGKPVEWSCIEGGAELVAQKMLKLVKGKVEYGKRVNKISQLPDADDSHCGELTLEVAGESQARGPYSTIFNTTSLACLQRIDLTQLPLHPSQKDAIRSLHYDDSAKVAIKFAYPWWITECGITTGGVASTDIPLRTCVYPSYNLDDGATNPAVLLCSYTWAQDATRVGSLIDNARSPQNEAELKDLMVHNLARLHLDNFNRVRLQRAQEAGVEPTKLTLADVTAVLDKAYLEHHAFSWSHDPYTSGAFALFGPGQFSNLYTYLSRPTAGSRFHFCGEASSVHHAWIVGSLDSATASVHRFLRRFNLWWDIAVLQEKWHAVPELEDDKHGTLHLQVALGMLPPKWMARV